MLLTKTHKHVGIGLFVMGLAFVTFAYPYDLQDFLSIVRGLQFVGTAFLFFGIFKKDPLHKDKFLLLWLIETAFFFGVLGYCSFDYIVRDFYAYDFLDFLGSFMILLCEWAATAAVGFCLYLIYKEYEELTKINAEAGLTISAVNGSNPPLETKEFPPPYITPTSENLTVSIQT